MKKPEVSRDGRGQGRDDRRHDRKWVITMGRPTAPKKDFSPSARPFPGLPAEIYGEAMRKLMNVIGTFTAGTQVVRVERSRQIHPDPPFINLTSAAVALSRGKRSESFCFREICLEVDNSEPEKAGKSKLQFDWHTINLYFRSRRSGAFPRIELAGNPRSSSYREDDLGRKCARVCRCIAVISRGKWIFVSASSSAIENRIIPSILPRSKWGKIQFADVEAIKSFCWLFPGSLASFRLGPFGRGAVAASKRVTWRICEHPQFRVYSAVLVLIC